MDNPPLSMKKKKGSEKQGLGGKGGDPEAMIRGGDRKPALG